MDPRDKKIAETLAKFGEPMASNVWRVQGTAVIYHKALERIAAQAEIHFDKPTIIRAERDEAIIQVTGYLGGHYLDGQLTGFSRMEWSIGEALVGVNYRVSGKQAAYVYAMAEKRAKDRVILKLIELHGLVYSEEEAEEFKQGRPQSERTSSPEQPNRIGPDPHEAAERELKQKIAKAKSINAVTDLMLHADTQELLNGMPEGVRDDIRDFAKARLVELGWPTASKAGGGRPREESDPASGGARDQNGNELPPHDPETGEIPMTDPAAEAKNSKPGESVEDKIVANIERRKHWESVDEFMAQKNTQAALKRLDASTVSRIEYAARAHKVSLGWQEPEGQDQGQLPAADDPTSRNVVATDPHHPTNLITLPTQIATALANVRTAEEVDEAIDAVLEERRVDWALVPDDIKAKVDKAAKTKIDFLERGPAQQSA